MFWHVNLTVYLVQWNLLTEATGIKATHKKYFRFNYHENYLNNIFNYTGTK